MVFLFLIAAAAIAYGSLYPFGISPAGVGWADFEAFIDTWGMRSGGSDLIGNVVLFFPFGLFGYAAAAERYPTGLRLAAVALATLLFASALQIAQLWLPARHAMLGDVVWNAAGAAVGALTAIVLGPSLHRLRDAVPRLLSAPAALLACWLGYRLFPFVPTLDPQSLSESVKPLLAGARLAPLELFAAAVSWLVAGYLLHATWRVGGIVPKLLVMMLGVFALEVLIVSNSLTVVDLAGAGIALVLAFARLASWSRGAETLALMLAAVLFADGLAPFTPRPTAVPFDWMPFASLLAGPVFDAALGVLHKAFLYGALVYLLRVAGLSWTAAGAATAGQLLLIGIAGMHIGTGAPGLTEPALALLVTAALVLFEGRRSTREPVARPA